MFGENAILKPFLVQMGITFFLLLWMAKERYQAFKKGDILILDPSARPIFKGRAGIISNAFHNQLEMPILFYSLVLAALLIKVVDESMVMLAWSYVGFRGLQALIHVTYNKILHRFLAYAMSNLVLIALWVILASRVL
ncbi:MAG: MAPEG family protein [Hyphomicrobium sp.]